MIENRRDIELFVARSGSLHAEGRYTESLREAQKASKLLSAIDNPAMNVRALFREAEALRMLGESTDALTRYGRILEYAYDPRLRNPLRLGLGNRKTDTTWHIAVAFMGWAQCARYVPGMNLQKLADGLDTGLAWLRSSGRSHWRAGLLLQRALLLYETGHTDQAVDVAEEALELAENHPDAPGPTLASYRRSLGDMLRAVERYEHAATQYRKVLDDTHAHVHDRNTSLHRLASCVLDTGDIERARQLANEAADEALSLGDSALCDALAVLVRVHRQAGALDEALDVVARQTQAAERTGNDYYRYFAIRDAADVALDRRALQRAKTLLDALLPLAAAMDRSRGGTTFALQLAARQRRLHEDDDAT